MQIHEHSQEETGCGVRASAKLQGSIASADRATSVLLPFLGSNSEALLLPTSLSQGELNVILQHQVLEAEENDREFLCTVSSQNTGKRN